MKKITLLLSMLLLICMSLDAQTSCIDLNGYVNSKNSGPTGYYTLLKGFEEKAAQTYYYSGPGKINSVRVHGNFPGVTAGVPLRVGIYNIDANGRPATLVSAVNTTWWWFNNPTGFINVNFGAGGIHISSDFAITVEIRNAFPWGDAFQLKYTGDGEGNGEDLASLAGTSTGFNWSGAMAAFNKDGDFYLEPKMTNFITSRFIPTLRCIQTGNSISFVNQSSVSVDSMFNKMKLSGYSGSNFIYTWDFGDGSPVSHDAAPSHAYATAGVYTVSLTVTLEGWNNTCSAVSTQQISVGLTAGAVSTPVSCFGGTNGVVTASGSGGAAPYLYRLVNRTDYQASNVFTGLAAGSYIVYVKDNLGCEAVTTVTVTEPTEIVISNIGSTNASCGNSNGAILVTASGGTGTLQYQLNSGPFQASNSFTGLSSGVYVVNVKDANNCMTTELKIVSDQGAPELNVISQTNISCYGANDGTIMLLGSGGSGTLQYSINAGATWQTGLTFSNLPAGEYNALVMDASGCKDGIKITLVQPEDISFRLSSTPVSCNNGNDGTITVDDAIGGTGSFSYGFNGNNYQSGNVFNGLSAGTYSIFVKDVAGCVKTAPVTVTEPAAMMASVQTVSADCYGSFDGSFTINASGGTSGYQYSLNGEDFQSDNTFTELEAGLYSVTIMDANGCEMETGATVTQPSDIAASVTTGSSTCGFSNGTMLVMASGGSGSGYQFSIDGSTFNSSGNFSSLTSGGYFIIVSDGTGCTKVFPANIADADGPEISTMNSTDVSCNKGSDGTITVNSVTGGTGTLQYSINGTTWQTSSVFTGLQSGVYYLLVKDANGCIGDSTITITEPNGFVMNSSVVNALCNDGNSGSITVNAAGGAGTLAYSIDGINFISSNTFSGLGAGTYTIVVRDAASCTGEINVIVTEPLEIHMFTAEYHVSCNGANDGIIYVIASGGTGALQYSIDGINYQPGNNFVGLDGGTYTVLAKDANGCTEISLVVINEPTLLSMTSVESNVSCAGGDNGVIDLSISGGVPPYSFLWNDFTTTEDKFNLEAGNYSVTVTDFNGCETTRSFTITEPSDPLIVNGTISDATSSTATDGEIDITITGGSGPYEFLWSNGAVSEDISGVAAGVYTVSITDDNGCVTSGTFIVSVSVGINSDEIQAEIQLYPNPAHEFFVVESGSGKIQKTEIINVVGQVVYTSSNTGNRIRINTDDLENGVYMVRIYVNDNFITKKVNIVR